jgi:NAD(P)-dependent dehydrogenase (short-subunit alcohol dehydrogenase family)
MGDALRDKVAVITGGGTGIGRAIASRFAAEGAIVVIAGRRLAELDDAVAEIGGRAFTVAADVSDLADLDRLYEAVQARAGRVDIVVANAGGGGFARLGEISEANFDDTFATNVKGAVFTVQKALPLMSRGGSVILIGSSASGRAAPSMSLYAASKAALRSFARTWMLDLKGRGIRVNVLSPGPVRTPGLMSLAEPGQEQEHLDRVARMIPLGRVGEADEIGQAALFLASDASSFVNGIELFVDGGHGQV